MRLPIDISSIPEKDRDNPTVQLLLDIIRLQAEQIQKLKDEIDKLKNHPRRPDIKPSRLGKKGKKASNKNKGKRAGSIKKKKTAELTIHKDEPVEPENIPVGSRFTGYSDFVVQGLKFEAYNIRYRRKIYETPSGGYVSGQLPARLNGKHFDPTLIEFILYQYYQCHVTQPLLLEQLAEIGIDISSGELNNLLIEEKERFYREKDRILSAGLEASAYVNVDDTGARHKGKNGYCTHIGNEYFSWFESTDSKSRINFLQLMRAGHSDFVINMDAVCYMHANKLPKYAIETIEKNLGKLFADDAQWSQFLSRNGIVKDRHVQIATQGVLIGAIVEHGLSRDLVIVSDDAGQFNVLLHALCWIHANRAIDKIVPFTNQAEKDLADVKDQIWRLYEGLKAYRENPTAADKKRLSAMFDEIFTRTTDSASLNLALKRIHNNKPELLLVLRRPDIPLHNNGAENAIREYVKKRKISGGTRSDTGRRARDTFTSLKKTCRKLGISFWRYLQDRIENIGRIPPLDELIRQQALNPG
jgi:hypothetical protein